MRFTVVDEKEIAKVCVKKKLKYIFKEFMSMKVKVAECNFREFDYKNEHCAYNCLHHGAKRHCVPVKVVKRGDSIYFVRTDM